MRNQDYSCDLSGVLGGCGVVLEVGGFLNQAFAVPGTDGGVDSCLRKNEAIIRWEIGFSFGLVHFDDVEKVVGILFFAGMTVFLELAELRHCPFKLTRETLAVQAQIG